MKSKTMTELVFDRTKQVEELTQRIGEKNSVINRQDILRVADEHLLKQAKYQIDALNDEVNDRIGDERTSNVVSLMIDERLKNQAAATEWTELTDPECVLLPDDEMSWKDNGRDSVGGWLTCGALGRAGERLKQLSDLFFLRRRYSLTPVVDDSPSPFSRPFTNPRSGMGIRK